MGCARQTCNISKTQRLDLCSPPSRCPRNHIRVYLRGHLAASPCIACHLAQDLTKYRRYHKLITRIGAQAAPRQTTKHASNLPRCQNTTLRFPMHEDKPPVHIVTAVIPFQQRGIASHIFPRCFSAHDPRTRRHIDGTPARGPITGRLPNTLHSGTQSTQCTQSTPSTPSTQSTHPAHSAQSATEPSGQCHHHITPVGARQSVRSEAVTITTRAMWSRLGSFLHQNPPTGYGMGWRCLL